MAKMMGPRFKLCRRLGVNVCGHPKAMKRESKSQRKLSDYGKHLLEKQKLRAYYGVLEKQFRRYVKKAMKSKQVSGEALVVSLECRLDNMIYRMGFASTIRQARQMVNHGHMLVNGNKVNIPSYEVKVGDEISLKQKSRKNENFVENFTNENGIIVNYIEKDKVNFTSKLVKIPERSEIPIEVNDQLVIEFYSKSL